MNGLRLPRSIFDFENKVKKLKDLNIEINDKDFWNNPQRAQKVSIEASTIEKLISSLENLETNLSDIKELIEITGEDNLNENDFLEEINNFEEMIEEMKLGTDTASQFREVVKKLRGVDVSRTITQS